MPRPHLTLRFPERTHPTSDDAPVTPEVRRLAQELPPLEETRPPAAGGHAYFSLPLTLLKLVEGEFGTEHFESGAWDLERQFAVDARRHWDRAGFVDLRHGGVAGDVDRHDGGQFPGFEFLGHRLPRSGTLLSTRSPPARQPRHANPHACSDAASWK